MKEIQVGFLMSYDYKLMKISLPLVYKDADEVTIALDKNLRTWTGEFFEVEEDFFQWLETFDTDKKIKIYRDDFFDSSLNPMENEVKERKMLASKMGVGAWIIQIDCDEYFVDFKKFTKELKRRNKYLIDPKNNPIQIAGYYINLYKYTDDGVLYISQPRNQKFATNYPSYVTGRNTKKQVIYIPHFVIHECLSRSEEEIKTKLTNWGHSHQINSEEFIEKWRKINKFNYKEFENLFYLEPEKWKKLSYVRGGSIEEIAQNFNFKTLKLSNSFILMKNFGQWFKFLFK